MVILYVYSFSIISLSCMVMAPKSTKDFLGDDRTHMSAQTSAYLGEDFIDSPPSYTFKSQNSHDAEQIVPGDFPPEEDPIPAEKPTIVAIMGPTGTGKSTFISKVAGRPMKIGHNLSSCEFNEFWARRRACCTCLLMI